MKKTATPILEIRQVEVHEGLVLDGMASLDRKAGRLSTASWITVAAIMAIVASSAIAQYPSNAQKEFRQALGNWATQFKAANSRAVCSELS